MQKPKNSPILPGVVKQPNFNDVAAECSVRDEDFTEQAMGLPAVVKEEEFSEAAAEY